MDATIVSAMAGIFGSLVGGSATVATAWVSQRTLTKRELVGAGDTDGIAKKNRTKPT